MYCCKVLSKIFHPGCHLATGVRFGVQDQFDGLLGADFMGDFCKPDPEAFEKVRTAPSACSLCSGGHSLLQPCTVPSAELLPCGLLMSRAASRRDVLLNARQHCWVQLQQCGMRLLPAACTLTELGC